MISGFMSRAIHQTVSQLPNIINRRQGLECLLSSARPTYYGCSADTTNKTSEHTPSFKLDADTRTAFRSADKKTENENTAFFSLVLLVLLRYRWCGHVTPFDGCAVLFLCSAIRETAEEWCPQVNDGLICHPSPSILHLTPRLQSTNHLTGVFG